MSASEAGVKRASPEGSPVDGVGGRQPDLLGAGFVLGAGVSCMRNTRVFQG